MKTKFGFKGESYSKCFDFLLFLLLFSRKFRLKHTTADHNVYE